MIDTISITIQQNDFEILDHNRFTPNSYNLFNPPFYKVSNNIFTLRNFPTKKDKSNFGYLPRVTLFKAARNGGFSIFLKIEFSAPKILFENNFTETTDSDLVELLNILQEKLLKLGVKVSIDKLFKAQISTIHYSKNIILTDYSTPYEYLKELSKINANKNLDFNQTDFRNEGHSIKFRNNQYEIALYDKLEDLKQAKKSEKRAEENDNFIQKQLLNKLKKTRTI